MYDPPTGPFADKDSYDEGYEAAKAGYDNWNLGCPYKSTGYDFRCDAEQWWDKGFNDYEKDSA